MALGATLPPNIHDDARIERLSGNARALYYESFSYCAGRETDGLIDAVALKKLRAIPSAKRELIASGVWGEREDGAIVVCGYLEHNTSRADAEAAREKARRRMEKHRYGERNAEQNGEQGSEQNGEQTDERNAERSANLPSALPSSLSMSDQSLNPEQSSVLSSSSEDCAGSARVSEIRAKRVDKPITLPLDWRPPTEAWDLAKQQWEASDRGLERWLADFRHYWTSGQGEGKRRNQKGWVRAWRNRMQVLATNGDLYGEPRLKPPGLAEHEKTRQAPRQEGAYQLFRDQPRVSDEDRPDPAEVRAMVASVGRRVR